VAYQKDYLVDKSGFGEIEDYYKKLRLPSPWSIESPEETWPTYNGPESKNFATYNMPIEGYPTADYINKTFPQLSFNKNDSGSYDATYTRTGRDLGNLGAYTGIWGSQGFHPASLDMLLDMASELDRVDPNVIYRSIRNRPYTSLIPPTTATGKSDGTLLMPST